MAAPRNILDRAEVLSRKRTHRFGLKSVADIDTQNTGHWMFGTDWMESCGLNVQVAPDNCDPALLPADLIKQEFALDNGPGTTDFTLYGLHQCSVIGTPINERIDYANDELNLGEWHQIEKHLMERIVADGTTTWATGISGAKNALAALLQSWALPVEPIVHMTPNVAVMLDDNISRHGNVLELTTGERVSVGHGYVTGLADLGKGWIALTGPVFGTQGPAKALTGEQLDAASNTYLALVERPFSIGYQCAATYVQVNAVGTLTA